MAIWRVNPPLSINIWCIDPSVFLLHGDLCSDAADLEDTASSLRGVLQWFPTGKRIYDPCLAIACPGPWPNKAVALLEKFPHPCSSRWNQKNWGSTKTSRQSVKYSVLSFDTIPQPEWRSTLDFAMPQAAQRTIFAQEGWKVANFLLKRLAWLSTNCWSPRWDGFIFNHLAFGSMNESERPGFKENKKV